MNKIEMNVIAAGFVPDLGSHAVLLKEKNGERLLPILIGPTEARAIIVEFYKTPFPRPLTHHIIRDVIRGLGEKLEEVTVTKMENKAFYAVMVIGSKEFDARPKRRDPGCARS